MRRQIVRGSMPVWARGGVEFGVSTIRWALSSIVYKIDRKVIISVFEIVLGEFKRCAFTYDS